LTRGQWVEPEIRDEMVVFVQKWRTKTGYTITRFVGWLGIGRSKYYDWMRRQGQKNQHNASQPKAHWLTDEEKVKIINYYQNH